MSIAQFAPTSKDRAAKRYGLAEAAELFFPEDPPHPATFTRWIVRGFASRKRPPERIKCLAERRPDRWVVTEAAVRDFIAKLTEDRIGEPAPAAESDVPGPEASEADRRLTALGI